MDNDIVEVRLNIQERDIREVKTDIKDINKSIVVIEKTNIQMSVDVKRVLDTYIVMRNGLIGFFIVNILGMIWTFNK